MDSSTGDLTVILTAAVFAAQRAQDAAILQSVVDFGKSAGLDWSIFAEAETALREIAQAA